MTESRSVVIRLAADTAQAISGLKAVSDQANRSADAMEAAGRRQAQAVDQLGTRAGQVGLIAAGGLLAAGKAAVEWESQWAGVSKTVDGTVSEMAELEDELRELARTMPATHEEIAATAEAAGQLGVAREDVAGFTETMLQLGETTNLTADEAATSIAQMANVLGTSQDDIDNVGAALVALGNDGASTEAQILGMAQRISGAGAQIGLAESDILAIANAAASMGVEVEAGGSAISRVFTAMAKATAQGGGDLERFAAVADMSAQQFVQAFENDPARAFAAFTGGLDRINKSGGDVFTTLEQLKLSDVRVSQALLGMAASGDLLTDSLDLGAEAFAENSALAEEFAKRAGTTASEITVAWNNVRDAGIDAGATLLPIISDVAETVSDLAGAFNDLPEPVQDSAVALAAVTAILGGGAWFGTKAIRGVAETNAALAALGREGTTVGTMMRRTVGPAAGMALAMSGVADSTGLAHTASYAMMGTLAGPWGAAVGAGIGLIKDLGAATSDLRADIDLTNASLEEMTSQQLEQLRAQIVANFAKLTNDTSGPGGFMGDLRRTWALVWDDLPAETEDAVARIDEQLTTLEGREASAASMAEYFGGTIDRTGDSLQRASGDADTFANSLKAVSAELDQRANFRDYQAALDSFTESLERNGRTIDIGTQKGRENQAALDNIATTALKVAENLEGMDQVKYLQRAREAFIDARLELGGTREAAGRLADRLGLLDTIVAEPTVDLDDKPAKTKHDGVNKLLRELGASKYTPVVDVDISAAQAAIEQVWSRLQWLNGQSATTWVTTRAANPSGMGPQLPSAPRPLEPAA